MNPHRILQPAVRLLGAHCSQKTPEAMQKLNLCRPFIVSDPFLASDACGILAQVTKHFDAAEMPHTIFTDTREDPTTDSVDACLKALQAGNYDCIVAVGGGSPMDTAKAAAVLHSHGGHMREYKAPFQMNKPSLPIVAVPTTAGTGSEATKFTVITDSETDEKMLCIGDAYMPMLAIVDYTLTMNMPRNLTAWTGVDALCHAMEAYVSKQSTPESDDYALDAIGRIGQSLEMACVIPHNVSAREGMMYGATMAGTAFSNSSVTLIHGMSRPLGAHFHVPHGLSNAMLAPSLTRYSIPGAVERYATVSRKFGLTVDPNWNDEQAAQDLWQGLRDLNTVLKVPALKDWNIDEAEFHKRIPVMAAAALASGSPANNPVVPDQEQIEELYREIWKGTFTETPN
jgi:alcohol dehydrogenase class IV